MKNATLRQLAVFETVAKHLHFTRAAEALGTTQPSVSMQVKQLEDNLGIALFEQVGKRIHLTVAGEELNRYCRNISKHLNEAQIVLDRLRGGKAGRLNIVVAQTAKYFMPRLIATFLRNYEDITVNMEIASREIMLARLADNACDMVIMGAPPVDQDLFAAAFLEDPLVVIAPPDHPLAQARAISPTRLAQESFLMRESDSSTRVAIEAYFDQQGIAINSRVQINSNEGIKRGVQAGLGLAVVPLHSVTLEFESRHLAVLDVANMHLQRSWFLVHRQGKRFSSVVEAFKEFLIHEGEQHIHHPAAVDAGAGEDVGESRPKSKRASR